jgi:MFS family permease
MGVQAQAGAMPVESVATDNDTHIWPSNRASAYGLTIIIVATLLNFFDANVFGMMVINIKQDFQLTDEQLGWLIGPANVLFFVFIGIPMAKLVDIYQRRYVIAGGMAAISLLTILSGIAQNFGQLFVSRMFVGAGGSAHAPGAYSMISDYYRPKHLARAIGFLQIGYIGGTALGMLLGGYLVKWASGQPPMEVLGLTIRGWQLVLIIVAAPSLLVAFLMSLAKEPPRRGIVNVGQSVPLMDVLREITRRKAVYVPLFIGLALSVTEAQGLLNWRVPFMSRTYGWSIEKIGAWGSIIFVASALTGVFFGTIFVEWLSKRYKDANVRSTAILFALAAPFSAAAPFMPNGEAAMACFALGGIFGLAASVPQNTAIQRLTPSHMRGQVTAIYLFLFTVFSALGSLFIGMITDRVFGNEADLWKAMAGIALVLMPMAAVAISFGIKPYGREIERLEALEKVST